MVRAIILFFVILVLMVNIAFIYLANRTFLGTVTENAYNKGLKYNDVILQESSQNKVVQGSIDYISASEHLILFNSSRSCDSAIFYLFSATGDGKDFDMNFPYSSSSYSIKLKNDTKGPWLIRVKCYIEENEYYFSKKINLYN